MILIVNLFSLKTVLLPTPEPELREINQNLELQNYREVYEMGSRDFKIKNTVQDVAKFKEAKIELGKENNQWVIVKMEDNRE